MKFDDNDDGTSISKIDRRIEQNTAKIPIYLEPLSQY